MTTNESSSNEQNNQEERANVSTAPKGSSGPPATAGDEQPMTKPTLLWFLVPVIVIALAVFLAR